MTHSNPFRRISSKSGEYEVLARYLLPAPPRQWIERQIAEWSITSQKIERGDVYRTCELPNHHRDPFDRLLVSAALSSDSIIITPDEAIHVYPVACVW